MKKDEKLDHSKFTEFSLNEDYCGYEKQAKFTRDENDSAGIYAVDIIYNMPIKHDFDYDEDEVYDETGSQGFRFEDYLRIAEDNNRRQRSRRAEPIW